MRAESNALLTSKNEEQRTCVMDSVSLPQIKKVSWNGRVRAKGSSVDGVQ